MARPPPGPAPSPPQFGGPAPGLPPKKKSGAAIILVIIVVLLFVCGAVGGLGYWAVTELNKSARVEVKCRGKLEEGWSCKVDHLEGNAKAKACWEIVIECDNGNTVKGKACETVKPGTDTKVRIDRDDIDDIEECDALTDFDVPDIEVTLVD